MKKILFLLTLLVSVQVSFGQNRFDGYYFLQTPAAPAVSNVSQSGKDAVRLNNSLFVVGIERSQAPATPSTVGSVFLNEHDLYTGVVLNSYELGIAATDVKMIETADRQMLICAYNYNKLGGNDVVTLVKIDQTLNISTGWPKSFSFLSPALGTIYDDDYTPQSVITSNHNPDVDQEIFYIAFPFKNPTNPYNNNCIDFALTALDNQGNYVFNSNPAPLLNTNAISYSSMTGYTDWNIPTDIYFPQPGMNLAPKPVVAGIRHQEPAHANAIPFEMAFTCMINSDGSRFIVYGPYTEHRTAAQTVNATGSGPIINRVLNPRIIGNSSSGYTIAWTEKETTFFPSPFPSGQNNRDGISLVNLAYNTYPTYGDVLQPVGAPNFFCGNVYNHLWSLSPDGRDPNNIVMNFYDGDTLSQGSQSFAHVDVSGTTPIVLDHIRSLYQVQDELTNHKIEPNSSYYYTSNAQRNSFNPQVYQYGLSVINPQFLHGCDNFNGLVNNTPNQNLQDEPRLEEGSDPSMDIPATVTLTAKQYARTICPVFPQPKLAPRKGQQASASSETTTEKLPVYVPTQNAVQLFEADYTEARLIDAAGRVLHSGFVSGNKIILPELQPGIYVVRLLRKNGTLENVKILK